jgi:hypothetical protein
LIKVKRGFYRVAIVYLRNGREAKEEDDDDERKYPHRRPRPDETMKLHGIGGTRMETSGGQGD